MSAMSQLLSQLRRAGIKLWTENGKLKFSAPPGALTPTLRDQVVANKPALIELLQAQAETVEDGPAPQRVDRSRPVLAASAQQRLWFLEQLDGPSATYHIPMAWRLEGELDTGLLQAALDKVITRHENLRTVFERRKGRPYQKITATPQTRLHLHDLRDLKAAERENKLGELLANDMQQPFDLAAAPPWRIAVWRLDETAWVLSLTAHHIIADGAALILLFRELAACYNAARKGIAADLAPLALQYVDYAAWQQQNLDSPHTKRATQFWRKTLRDLPPQLDLPTDLPRPAHGGREALVHRFAIDDPLWQRLQQFCSSNGHTPFTVLLAAFKVLLARTCGQNDIVVGTPVANREQAVWQPLIGLFINTLVVRSRLNMDEAFSVLLQQLRDTVLKAREHSSVPFDKIVQITAPERRYGDAPLFQALFNLEQETAGDFDFAGLRKTPYYRPTVTAKFDLLFSIKEAEDGRWCFIEVPAATYERETMVAFGAQYCLLLDALIRQPAQDLRRPPLLSDEASETLVKRWNQTLCDYGDTWLPDMARHQALRTPDATALVFGAQTWTYRQWNTAVDHLAAALQQRGIGRETVVGICLERCFDMVVAIHAVLRAGAAYMPLDPELPAPRLSDMIAQGQPTLVLTHARFRDLLPSQTETMALDQKPAPPADFTAPALDGDQAAYLIFTSGSTGRPKGVLVTHRAVHNRVAWMQAEYPLLADDVVLQKTPFSFDVSVWEFLWPLAVGAKMVVAEAGDHRDNHRLCDLIQQHHVTTLHFVPFMLRAFLECESVTDCVSLRRVFASGEALDEPLRRRTHQRLAVELHNLYGPTEAAVDVSYHDCAKARREGIVPIGRPIANLELHIVDELGRPTPRGVAGELMIGGVGLARGYIHQPALTADRFVPDPFSGRPGARLYRTGDRARFLADGAIAFLGRLDHQVKIRGFRIELGEIEALLTRYPGVQAAAAAVHDVGDNPQLVAWLLSQNDQLEPAEIQSFLGEQLPSHMIPAQFIVRAEMPMTTSGKLDRKHLPAPSQTTAAARRYRAPSNPREQQMCDIWAALLGLPRVGVDDPFFHIGGHSLLATQAVSLIAERMQARLELRDLFAAPTVAEAVTRLQPLEEQSGSLLKPRRRPANLPLSFAQQRLWFLERLEDPGPTYNMPAGLRIRGDLNMAALFAAVEAVINRHESLRTNFAEGEQGPVQVIHPHQQLDLRRRDLRATDPDHREKAAYEWLQEQARQPFDLAEDTLFRLALVQLGDRDFGLLVVMHHIVSDGWSLGVLVKEFTQLYEAFDQDRPSPLAPLPLQYADFALWQREKMDEREVQRHLAFWGEQLRDLQPLELPTDHPRPPVQTHNGDTAYFELENDTLQALQSLSRTHGVSLFMTLLSAFYILLGRYSAQTDIAVGSPIANRTRRELEGLIGFFVNTLVLRADLSGNPDFLTLLAQVKASCLAAYTHQDLPFEQLADELQPERHLSHALWFQVMFNVQQSVAEGNSLGNLDVSTWHFSTTSAKFDLTFALVEKDDGLYGSMEFNRDLFERDTVERLLAHYATLLRHIAAAPDTPIDRLRLEEPRTEAVATPSLSRYATWPDWFEAVVATHPQRRALDDGRDHLTYAELDRRVNQTAHVLSQHGANNEQAVALCLPRGIDFVVCALAVQKAGGFYLPLDPHTPPERLQLLLNDADPCLLVTAANTATLEDGIPRLTLEALNQQAAEAPTEAPKRAGGAADPAYLMYTSGSSGRPKGVIVPHRALVNHNLAALDLYELQPNDRVSQFSSISFDISVEEIFATLVAGACLCPFPQDFDLTPDAFEHRLCEQRLSVVNLPTAYWADWGRSAGSLPAGLRAVIIGGEACTPAALNHWRRKSDNRITLYNTYGPTETTIIATAWRDDPSRPVPATVPIGRPIAGVTCQVLDKAGRPVPTGTPGELYIGGAGLAVGYHGDPDLTEQAFVLDQNGRRFYRSGDRVRQTADGNLVFLGRVDQQVKISGFRVEPGEVEQVLQALPGVAQSAVLVQHHADQNRLIGFYAAPEQQSPNRVRTALNQQLPRYMVPAVLVRLAQLPQTTTGKIDRQRLAAQIPEREERAGTRRVPEGPTAEAVAAVWQTVLGVTDIGLDDNFFDLGGSSLPAVRVMTQLQQRWELALSIRALFEAPQLEAFVFTVLQARAQTCGEDELEELVAEVPEDRVETFLERLVCG